MYEELIESSRACAMRYNGNCDRCLFCGMSNDKNGECYQQLHKAAAEAIGDMNRSIDGLEADNESLCQKIEELSRQCEQLQYMPSPAWIPVTERLPEEPYGCLAIVWDNNVMTGDTFLNYYPEYIGFDGESWNDCDGEEIPLEVVYWMKMPKIPEPPKGET